MVAVIPLILVLALLSCGGGAGGPQGSSSSGRPEASSKNGPSIDEMTIEPETPTAGEEATATIVIRDDAGVVGFRLTLGDKSREISCDNQTVCRKTITRPVPMVASPSITLTVIAENTAGERTRREKQIDILPGTATADRSASPPPPTAGTPELGTLLLRSGFEDGVTLQSPRVVKGNWEQYLTGSDQGYEWGSLPNRSSHPNRITYLVSSGKQIDRYAISRIETVDGRDGKPTRALYMGLMKEDTATKAGSRVQFGIYPEASFTQAYVRYWVKLQPDLASKVLPRGQTRSRQIMEWKETGKPRADFRISMYIKRDRSGGDLFWRTQAQWGDLSRSDVAWDCTSRVPVPVGEWFLLEVFWKLHPTDGRVWGAANGKVFVDYIGTTQRDSGLFVWWPFKLYVGTALQQFESTPLYQWIDDVEFAREPPSPLPASPQGDFTCKRG